MPACSPTGSPTTVSIVYGRTIGCPLSANWRHPSGSRHLDSTRPSGGPTSTVSTPPWTTSAAPRSSPEGALETRPLPTGPRASSLERTRGHRTWTPAATIGLRLFRSSTITFRMGSQRQEDSDSGSISEIVAKEPDPVHECHLHPVGLRHQRQLPERRPDHDGRWHAVQAGWIGAVSRRGSAPRLRWNPATLCAVGWSHSGHGLRRAPRRQLSASWDQ